jgi:hypothetical protein
MVAGGTTCMSQWWTSADTHGEVAAHAMIHFTDDLHENMGMPDFEDEVADRADDCKILD